MFHYERHRNHSKSRQTAMKQIAKLQESKALLHNEKNYPVSELEFFDETAKCIIQCRQVLKWTYVVGYFMEGKDAQFNKGEVTLFKYQQTMLEEACEIAHKFMESDITPFIDPESVDRKPFYHFKSAMMQKNQTLRQSYESFTKAILDK